jgi:NAD(P)H-hydrate epimerase
MNRATPLPTLSREQCRAVDRYAIEQLGIPGIVLMENAGHNAADAISRWGVQQLRRLNREVGGPDPLVCVVCGKGNNGGDGFVIARHLANRGWPVCVDLAAEPASLSGDAAINYRIVDWMGVPIRELNGPIALDQAATRWGQAVVVVDALLGTGFAGEVREPLAGVIHRLNAVGNKSAVTAPLIVAIDVPSGLDADTGTAAGPVVRADRTITFLANKIGYENRVARAYLGRVTVCGIGAPTELILRCLRIAGQIIGNG